MLFRSNMINVGYLITRMAIERKESRGLHYTIDYPVHAYDKNFLGDHHPVTSVVAVACLIGSCFIFRKQLRLSTWGANIRMAIATVVVFWVPVEVLGRLDFFKEIWIEPEKYTTQMICILVAFVALLIYIMMAARKKKVEVIKEN